MLPRRVGYVPQLESVDWHFPITVAETVFLGRVSDAGVLPWPSRRDRSEVAALLERLGIDSVHDLPPLGDFVPSAEVVERLEQGLSADG